QLGPALSTHPAFPEGVNVSFATLAAPNHIELRVWERGAGPTLACGTGACATAAAAWWEQRVDPSAVRVDLPGGRLIIEGTPKALTMVGPAERVFSGEWGER
ncbi:MAG: diaminopimelate epimerase, partial [bacterium]